LREVEIRNEDLGEQGERESEDLFKKNQIMAIP
jgi:hypothetical protein